MISNEWRIVFIILAIFLALAVMSFVRKSFQIGILFAVICITIYILSYANLGPIMTKVVDSSKQTMEEVTGQTSDELEERGESALGTIKEWGSSIIEWIKE